MSGDAFLIEVPASRSPGRWVRLGSVVILTPTAGRGYPYRSSCSDESETMAGGRSWSTAHHERTRPQ